MHGELQGKRALVTGASRGIGSAIALELARGGADIVLHYVRDAESARQMQRQIEQQGVVCTLAQADLCDPEGAQALADQMGDLDILVLNASVQYSKPWEQITKEEFYRQINCNLLASLLLIQQAAPYMRRQHWGRIVTIGSVQEAKPHPDMLVYSASKAAQTNMAKSLALQLAQDGITVNNVAPGVISTDRNKDALADADYARQVLRLIPVGFYGEKQDCAPVVRLLCSDAGRYITGQTIFVDGGKSL